MQQAAGDLQPPAHAAGERHHRLVGAVGEVHHVEHLAHPARDRGGLDAVQLGVQAQVLRGGEVAVERRVLEDETDVAAHGVAPRGHVEAADVGGAGGRGDQRAEHVDGRALAGAVGAEEAEDLAAVDRERHAPDGLDVPVGLGEVDDLDGGNGGRHARSRITLQSL